MAMRDPVIEQMDAGEPVAETELLGLVASRELALGWVEDREAHRELGTALAQLALQAPQDSEHRALLERAVDALRAGVAAAPADPRHWMQLGHLFVVLEGDLNRQAAAALLFSMRVGAFQAPDLIRRRLFWALAHWSFYTTRNGGRSPIRSGSALRARRGCRLALYDPNSWTDRLGPRGGAGGAAAPSCGACLATPLSAGAVRFAPPGASRLLITDHRALACPAAWRREPSSWTEGHERAP